MPNFANVRFQDRLPLDGRCVGGVPRVGRFITGKRSVAAERKPFPWRDRPKIGRVGTEGPVDHLPHFVDGVPHDLHMVPQALDRLAEFLHVLVGRQVAAVGGR